MLAALVVTRRQDVTTPTGFEMAALLFVAPLCAHSMALFSAREAQHLLLTLLAARLLASALGTVRPPAAILAEAFAVLFWFWHMY